MQMLILIPVCDWCKQPPPKNTKLERLQSCDGSVLVCEPCLKRMLARQVKRPKPSPLCGFGQLSFNF